MPLAADIDARVRLAVYRQFAETGVAPSRADVARLLDLCLADIRDSFDRLNRGHVLVLDEAGEIWMAMPFSAVPTAFRVTDGRRWWWANCAWDALGIASALAADIDVRTSCHDCGASLSARVSGGVVSGDGVVHVAVPAVHWWDDIGFT